MSIVSGTIGAIRGSNAQQNAATTAAGASDRASEASLALQEKMYNQSRADFEPYRGLGVATAPKLAGYDQFSGVGGAVNWDTEYTNKLGAYEEDPGTRAAKALGQRGLSQQMQARGLNYGSAGAEAAGELNQKYDVQGYDKYKAQLTDRYKALQGEYSLRRDKASTGYQQLLDQVKIGQGAANSTAGAGTNFANQGTGIFQNLGNSQAGASIAQGNNTANMVTGLANIPNNVMQTASNFNKMTDTNKSWWG